MSLQLICDYASDGEDETDMPIEVEQDTRPSSINQIDQLVWDVVQSLLNKVEKESTQPLNFDSYRNAQPSSDESESDCSMSDVWSLSDSDEYDLDNSQVGRKRVNNCFTKGELFLHDLPPIERLQINVHVQDLIQVGIIGSIVDQLVIIQSFKNVPILDIDSVLFSKDGSSLGQIFDVIGPVKQPNYILRFNSVNEIENLKLSTNLPVYYAENQRESITKYVFVQQLQMEKGSDASWKDNNEPPPEAIDYSDDEVERVEKWKRKAKLRKK